MSSSTEAKGQSLRALTWLNFFVADVQTGLGPLIAAYLAANGWSPSRLGVFLTLGGLLPIALQIPAGGMVDEMRSKRAFAAVSITLIATGALLLKAGGPRFRLWHLLRPASGWLDFSSDPS